MTPATPEEQKEEINFELLPPRPTDLDSGFVEFEEKRHDLPEWAFNLIESRGYAKGFSDAIQQAIEVVKDLDDTSIHDGLGCTNIECHCGCISAEHILTRLSTLKSSKP